MLRLILVALATVPVLVAGAQPALRVTGPPVALTAEDAGPFVGPRWSPDGTRIAFGAGGYAGLWTVRPDGSGLTQVSAEPAAGFGFSWSADGSSLLARVARDEGGRRDHAVVLYDVASGDARFLTGFRPSMPSLPGWAPGTADVALPERSGLARLESGLPASARKAGAAERFVVLRDGRPVMADAVARTVQPMDLFPDETLLNLVTSPDGDRVTFEVLGGHAWVLTVSTGQTVDLGALHRPQWSPDGRWIVAMTTADDGERFLASDLVAVRSDGSASVQLTDTPDRLEMNPSWSPDGRSLVYDDLRNGVIYLLPVAE